MSHIRRMIWLAMLIMAVVVATVFVLGRQARAQTQTHILNPPAAAASACGKPSPGGETQCDVHGTLVSESEPFPLNPDLTTLASQGSSFANAFGYGNNYGADALATGPSSSSDAVAIVPFHVENAGSWFIDFTFSASAQAAGFGSTAGWSVEIGTLLSPLAVVPGTGPVPNLGFVGPTVGGSTAPAWSGLEFPLYQWEGDEGRSSTGRCRSGFTFDNFNGPHEIPTEVDVSSTDCGHGDRSVTFPILVTGAEGYVVKVFANAFGSIFDAPGSGDAIVDPVLSVDSRNPNAILKIDAPVRGTQQSLLTSDQVAAFTAAGLSVDRLRNVGIKLPPTNNATPPVTTALVTPLPNGFGWNNTDVVVTLNAADSGGPGVRQIAFSSAGSQDIPSTVVPGNSATIVINAEGHTTVSFFATDVAGNIEAAKTLTINLDKTPPTITGSRMPAANQYGWNNTDVTVSFSCSDALSGLAPGSPPANTVVSTEGAGQSVNGTCTDLAGNLASYAVAGINIDKTPPTVACGATPNVLWPPNNKLVPVSASVTVTDTLSGAAGFRLNSVTSSEPDSGQGDIQGFAPGTPSTSGQLRAQRLGSGSGRVYTLNYVGVDKAGNSYTCASIVRVPHDQGQN